MELTYQNTYYQLPFYSTNTPIVSDSKEIIRTYSEFEFNSNGIKKKVATDPIKDRNDLESIKSYFLAQNRYRDYAIFVLGINTALRCSDILALNIHNVVTDDGYIVDRTKIKEKKTGNIKELVFNQAAKEALYLYLEDLGKVSQYYLQPDQPLFRSQKISKLTNEYRLTPKSYYDIQQKVKAELNLSENIGTHTMRKTFGYNYFKLTKNMELTSKAIGHKSVATTMAYIGITNEEINNAILELNL